MGLLTLTRRDFSRRGATFRTQTRCYFGHSIGVLSFVIQLRYVDKEMIFVNSLYIFDSNNGSVYLKEHIATGINMIK